MSDAELHVTQESQRALLELVNRIYKESNRSARNIVRQTVFQVVRSAKAATPHKKGVAQKFRRIIKNDAEKARDLGAKWRIEKFTNEGIKWLPTDFNDRKSNPLAKIRYRGAAYNSWNHILEDLGRNIKDRSNPILARMSNAGFANEKKKKDNFTIVIGNTYRPMLSIAPDSMEKGLTKGRKVLEHNHLAEMAKKMEKRFK